MADQSNIERIKLQQREIMDTNQISTSNNQLSQAEQSEIIDSLNRASEDEQISDLTDITEIIEARERRLGSRVSGGGLLANHESLKKEVLAYKAHRHADFAAIAEKTQAQLKESDRLMNLKLGVQQEQREIELVRPYLHIAQRIAQFNIYDINSIGDWLEAVREKTVSESISADTASMSIASELKYYRKKGGLEIHNKNVEHRAVSLDNYIRQNQPIADAIATLQAKKFNQQDIETLVSWVKTWRETKEVKPILPENIVHRVNPDNVFAYLTEDKLAPSTPPQNKRRRQKSKKSDVEPQIQLTSL